MHVDMLNIRDGGRGETLLPLNHRSCLQSCLLAPEDKLFLSKSCWSACIFHKVKVFPVCSSSLKLVNLNHHAAVIKTKISCVLTCEFLLTSCSLSPACLLSSDCVSIFTSCDVTPCCVCVSHDAGSLTSVHLDPSHHVSFFVWDSTEAGRIMEWDAAWC